MSAIVAERTPTGTEAAPIAADAAAIGAAETNRLAQEDTLLAPRFYTTDFEKLDRTDVSSVRVEWDALIAELKADLNRSHFRRTEAWDKVDLLSCPRGCGRSSSTSW